MSPNFILATIGVILYASFTATHYYLGMPRIESVTSLTMWYLSGVFLPLFAYIFIKKSDWNAYRIRLSTILGYFFWVLMITAIMSFTALDPSIGGTTSQRIWLGFEFFFQIIKYLLCVFPFGIILAGFGRRLLDRTHILEHLPDGAKTPISTGVGWSVFMLIFAIIGFFGWYNLWVFYSLLAGATALTYREIWNVLRSLHETVFEVPKNQFSVARLIVNSILLGTLCIGLSVNFANIVRPYPIGWDDLGVYMNYPKMMAFAQSTAHETIMMWQSFTGIGFLHQSATLAFFLNSFWGVLAILGIWSGIRFFVPKNNPLISLPLFSVTLFMSIPMIVFQQAKDMKLDPGLLGISIFSVIALFLALRIEDSTKEKRIRNGLYLLAGGLMGIAFAIKFTTLMCIIAAISVLFYARLSILGFFGFLSMFIGIFTTFRLWNFMNVNYPRDSEYLTLFWIWLVVLWLGLSWASARLNKIRLNTIISHVVIPTTLLLIGFSTTLGPWIIKNVTEVWLKNVSIGAILNGDPGTFIADFKKIHDEEKLRKIEETSRQNVISQEWKTQNEDLGRYFGYEKGINNYLKLPVNLTLQTNQKGEFTDIGYVFLALVPGMLLFRFRKRIWQAAYFCYLVAFFVLFFFKNPNITGFLSTIELPLGYIPIVFAVLLPFTLLHFDHAEPHKKSEEDPVFLPLLGFVSLYSLIFIVSAFGIVWYGILMYFWFLALLAFSANLPDAPESRSAYLGWIVALVSLPYFFLSVIPHAWGNLPEDSLEYKVGKTSEFESIFSGRPEYIKVLSKLNLRDSAVVDSEIRSATTNPDMKKIFDTYPGTELPETISLLDMAIRLWTERKTPQFSALAKEAKNLKELAFKRILYPNPDNRNQEKIYRIGTFLSYYIIENRRRFYEDSLISWFDTYIDGGDRETSADNISKLGIKYLLVDLNAATIDQDPRRDLTRRYEKILDLVRSKKIRLITTDSPCLQVALELPADQNYMNLAWINYVSFSRDASGNPTGAIAPQSKEEFCAKAISQLISENRINEKSFAGLQGIAQYVAAKNPRNADEIYSVVRPLIGRSWMAAFEVLP